MFPIQIPSLTVSPRAENVAHYEHTNMNIVNNEHTNMNIMNIHINIMNIQILTS